MSPGPPHHVVALVICSENLLRRLRLPCALEELAHLCGACRREVDRIHSAAGRWPPHDLLVGAGLLVDQRPRFVRVDVNVEVLPACGTVARSSP